MVMKHLRWKSLCLFVMVISGCATMTRDFGKIVPDQSGNEGF